ncbi:Ankyrin repeat-containing protein ITN1, partial [Bienertia sinuspersici]
MLNYLFTGGNFPRNLEHDDNNMVLGVGKPKLIYEMIDANPMAIFEQDCEGMNPLLRAAQYGRVLVVHRILTHHINSIDCCDRKRRGLLHHLRLRMANLNARDKESTLLICKRILELPGIDDILTHIRDQDGNTPLHLAILDQDFDLALLILQRFVITQEESYLKNDLSMDYKMITKIFKPNKGSVVFHLITSKNNEGKTVFDFITSGQHIPTKLKKMMEVANTGNIMHEELHHMAKSAEKWVRMMKIVVNQNTDDILSQDEDGSNIMHIAIQKGHQFMMKEAIKTCPKLMYQKDCNGDTPLHIAARLQSPAAQTAMRIFIRYWINNYMKDTLCVAPWRLKNYKGHTPLHEAARTSNYNNLKILTEHVQYLLHNTTDGGDAISDVNEDGETFLHLIARCGQDPTAKDFLEKVSEQMGSIIYMRDMEGFTPVLRAVQCGRLGVAKLLVRQFPKSVKIPDNKGRTVLHHLRALVVDLIDDVKDVLPVWKDFYKQSEIDDLRIAQNEDGNTPLHLTIIDADFIKVKFLMEICHQSHDKRELTIVNNDGHTVFDLLTSQAHIPAMKELQQLMSRSYVKERELINERMDDMLYQAALEGDVEIFTTMACDHTLNDVESGSLKLDEAYYSSLTPGGSNIIHIALRRGNSDNVIKFVQTALQHFPDLSIRKDSNGDTPLHLAAKWKGGVSLVKSLIQASKDFLRPLQESKKAFYVAPWAVKNYKGSFPIHEALQIDNLEVAHTLLGSDEEAAFRVNDLGETPLHSFAKNGFSGNDTKVDEFVKELIAKNKQAAYTQDNEGVTPLLSAARSGRFHVVRAILQHEPQSAYLRDPNGRTFLHLLRFTGEDVDENFASTFKKTERELFNIPEADAQRLVQDYDGNTPLHYAIQTQNYIAAIVFTQRCLEFEDRVELGLMNREGQTIPDILPLHEVPNEIIELIRKKVPKAVYLARSSYGIRKTEMKDSANALSVVAALLATITFAAAFQVPGGFDGDNGSPILLLKPAFMLFVVANTVAMCSSMLCLFLLLWVMGIGKVHGSLKVLDISIILLRISFYLTLLAFATGVFVVTVEKSLWMGILVCVLGFLTFLLTLKVSIEAVAKYGGRVNSSIKYFINLVKSIYKTASPPVPNTDWSD